MAEIILAKVKSIYGELRGYLDTLPTPYGYNGPTLIGKRFNALCDELTRITNTDYSYAKLDEADNDKDYNGFAFDGATLKTSVSGLVSRLESEFGFQQQTTNIQPALIINNQNSNTIDININFTIETLIDNAATDEEKEKLQIINDELKKPDAQWGKIKPALSWIINFSKDLSLKVIPIILNYYLKRG